MGRSRETYSKKEIKNKKAKKRIDKANRKLEKKEQGKNGGFNEMLAYIDENGNISSTPPDNSKMKSKIDANQIEISVSKSTSRQNSYRKIRTGKIINYNEAKGYGFIIDSVTRDSIFVHINDCSIELQQDINVEFETTRGNNGLKAINVKNIT